MAIYGTYAQNGDTFTITNVSSSSDTKDPAFTYDWSCNNHNWTFHATGTTATVSDAHASETGDVTVKVTEVGNTTNSKEFGGRVDTRTFPA